MSKLAQAHCIDTHTNSFEVEVVWAPVGWICGAFKPLLYLFTCCVFVVIVLLYCCYCCLFVIDTVVDVDVDVVVVVVVVVVIALLCLLLFFIVLLLVNGIRKK